MNTARNLTYKTYSTETKLKLIQNGNPNHFTDQGVPRTTAIYWLKNSQKIQSTNPQADNFADIKINRLQRQLNNEVALKNLLIKVRKLHPFSFSKKKVTSKPVKKELVRSIFELKNQGLSLKLILNTITLSPSTFYRWQTLLQPGLRSKIAINLRASSSSI